MTLVLAVLKQNYVFCLGPLWPGLMLFFEIVSQYKGPGSNYEHPAHSWVCQCQAGVWMLGAAFLFLKYEMR